MVSVQHAVNPESLPHLRLQQGETCMPLNCKTLSQPGSGIVHYFVLLPNALVPGSNPVGLAP